MYSSHAAWDPFCVTSTVAAASYVQENPFEADSSGIFSLCISCLCWAVRGCHLAGFLRCRQRQIPCPNRKEPSRACRASRGQGTDRLYRKRKPNDRAFMYSTVRFGILRLG